MDGTGENDQPISIGGLAADVVRRADDGAWRFVIDNPFTDAIIGAG